MNIIVFCPCSAVVSQLVTGYLPSVILHFLSSYVPSIMKLFSTMQGFVSVSGIERSACNKMLRFTIWTVFFANVLTGSVFSQYEIFLDPKELPTKLAVLVPAQVAYAFLVSFNEVMNHNIAHIGPFFAVFFKKVVTNYFWNICSSFYVSHGIGISFHLDIH